MRLYGILMLTLIWLNQQAYAEIYDINNIVREDCRDISSRGDEYGKFGSKSRGRSFGTTAAHVIFALQEQYEDLDSDKFRSPKNFRSVYTICKYALREIDRLEAKLLDKGYMRSDISKYIDDNVNFIRLLDKEVGRVIANNGLVVFVSFDEPR